MRMIREIAIKKKLNVSTNYDSEILYFRTDERRLKQILVNLLSNAVKFTPDGGNIGLDIHAVAENNRLCFSVWDTGIGISREDQEKLFTPFVQLDSSLSKSYEGSGLGLALVMRLVKILGGDIAVESEKGKGSRFTLNLDMDPPDMA